MTPRSLAPLLAGALAVAAACNTAPAARPLRPAGTPCREVVTPAAAQGFFRRLTAVHPDDGCELDGVTTASSRIEVRFTAVRRPLPPALVAPGACAADGDALGGACALPVPPALAGRCPHAVAALTEALADGALGTGRVPEARTPRYGLGAARVLELGALLFAVILAGEWYFARRARGTLR